MISKRAVETLLFRTVYGPELALMHRYLAAHPCQRDPLLAAFVRSPIHTTEATNAEEALQFLLDLDLVHQNESALTANPADDFTLAVLTRLTRRADDPDGRGDSLDPWVMRLLDRLFCQPDTHYVANLHPAANALDLPKPLNADKLNAWKRVMEYLGCGYRILSGFCACYSPDLVLRVLQQTAPDPRPLEECLEGISRYLPWRSRTGEISRCLAVPLQYLERQGQVRLEPWQDSPGRAFLGPRRVKWVALEGRMV